MADYAHDPDDFTPLMTANDAPSPNVASASSEYHLGPAFEAFDHAVGPTNTKSWTTGGATTGWLKFDFGEGNEKTVVKYTLSNDAYSGYEGRAPKTWTLQGSNNDSDWDVLDTQTNVSAWSTSEMRTYEFVNSTPYRYYKLDITENQGTAYLTVGELELIGAGTVTEIVDLETEIKASEEIITDLTSEIIAGLEFLTDLNSEITASGTSLTDLKTDIAADFLTNFSNLKTEVYAKAQQIIDLVTDVKAGNQALIDLNIDTEAKAQVLSDLLTDIRAQYATFKNLNTEITAVRSKWWLKTEIKAGCAARWNFNTEWNPDRFLNTAIEAKKPYGFSFKTQGEEGYAATEPSVEIKVPGYSFPLRTLFLDYISVGSSNIYPLELWWARGLTGRGTLKNTKIKAEYIDTSNSGGHEIISLDWISIKVGDGEYQTVNEDAVTLGNILCDSKLDVTLKVECRDCSYTRGLAFFKLIITGDWKEAIWGDSIVYRDGSVYHSGLQDDYRSIDFVSRLYIVGG